MLLPAGYDMRLVERFEEPAFTKLVRSVLLNDASHIPSSALGQGNQPALRERRGMRRVGIFHGDELVAFTFGWHDFDDRYYMAASGVRAAHRRRGFYTHLVNHTLTICRNEGYSQVWSRHLATNNPVLIAKLKLGFLITGVNVSAAHGVMVHLALPLSEAHRQAMHVRSGLKKAPKLLQPFLVNQDDIGMMMTNGPRRPPGDSQENP